MFFHSFIKNSVLKRIWVVLIIFSFANSKSEQLFERWKLLFKFFFSLMSFYGNISSSFFFIVCGNSRRDNNVKWSMRFSRLINKIAGEFWKWNGKKFSWEWKNKTDDYVSSIFGMGVFNKKVETSIKRLRNSNKVRIKKSSWIILRLSLVILGIRKCLIEI